MFNFLMNEPDNIPFFSSLKYVLQADDDLFIRVDQFLRWISYVEKSGLAYLPIVGNNVGTRPNARGVWHILGCGEITQTGWYHPFFINKPAMEKLRIASASWGYMDTCKSFNVSQDVGGSVYFWLFGFYHIRIPGNKIFVCFLCRLKFSFSFFSSFFYLLSVYLVYQEWK
jgi:hypothetical protein